MNARWLAGALAKTLNLMALCQINTIINSHLKRWSLAGYIATKLL